MEANWANRTLFHGDNLKFLRAMNSESVDLIATDPPFNKAGISTRRRTAWPLGQSFRTGGHGSGTFTRNG